MMDIEDFLEDCVYYPCSGMDGFPVKFLSSRFQRFFYVDGSTSREDFERRVTDPGFDGYRVDTIDELSPEDVFGESWREIEQRYEQTFARLTLEWTDQFLLIYRFERLAEFADSHSPESFDLLVARCEAITAFELTFSRRNLAPQCLAHINSGVSFGGNYSQYPEKLSAALRPRTSAVHCAGSKLGGAGGTRAKPSTHCEGGGGGQS
jgi:hypothetical protein